MYDPLDCEEEGVELRETMAQSPSVSPEELPWGLVVLGRAFSTVAGGTGGENGRLAASVLGIVEPEDGGAHVGAREHMGAEANETEEDGVEMEETEKEHTTASPRGLRRGFVVLGNVFQKVVGGVGGVLGCLAAAAFGTAETEDAVAHVGAGEHVGMDGRTTDVETVDSPCPAHSTRKRHASCRSRGARQRRAARRRGSPLKRRTIRGRHYRQHAGTPLVRVVMRNTALPTTTMAMAMETTHLFPASFVRQWLLKGGSIYSLERASIRGGAELCARCSAPAKYGVFGGNAEFCQSHFPVEKGMVDLIIG